MRIGFVLSSAPGYSETFFKSKIAGLIAAGHQVVLFTGRNESGFDLCPVICAPKIYRFLPLRISKVMLRVLYLSITIPNRIIRFYGAERSARINFKQILENIYINSHILTQDLDWLHFGFATTAIRRENVALSIGAKMGVSIRGYDIGIYPLKHPGCYKLLWERVDKIHTISNGLVEVAKRHGLKNEIPVTRITPAINTQLFNRKAPFSELGSPVKILTVSRLTWKKGLETTLQALALLKEKGISFHYTIIGDGEELHRLSFAVHQFGIVKHVTFAGEKSHDQVKQAMENADIYLQYSLQEGFCNAVLEAQSMGLLCVVSNAEGLAENVINNQTGWVVPRRKPKLFAEKIIELIGTSLPALNIVRSNAMIRVQKEFNLEKQQAAFNDFFINKPSNK